MNTLASRKYLSLKYDFKIQLAEYCLWQSLYKLYIFANIDPLYRVS